MRRSLLLAALVACAIAPAAAYAEVAEIVTIDGVDFEVRGESTTAPAPVNAEAVLKQVRVPTTAVCKPTSVDMQIGELTERTLVAVPTGDVYYEWSAPTVVDIQGCGPAISRQQYIDQPIVGTGATERSPVYELRGTGRLVQAPRWMVPYYSPLNLYQRAQIGSLTVRLEGLYVSTGIEVRAGCRTRTWYFAASPDGAHNTSDTGTQPC